MKRSLIVLGILAIVCSPALSRDIPSGSWVLVSHLKMGTQPPACVLPDNGSGTVYLPPEGCDYLSPTEVHMILDGLPSEATILLDPVHANFFNINRTPGGVFGGEIETFDSSLYFAVTGTGPLSGLSTTLTIPVSCEVHI